MKTHDQASPYSSPYTLGHRLRMLAWGIVWGGLCSWTPKPFNFWRLLVLRAFGTRMTGTPFVHQRARIQQPWNLSLEDRACLGDRANAYSLGLITLGKGCTIAQEAYLCTGSHDFDATSLNLTTAPIHIGARAFVGARALILPGVSIGENCIVGAGSVVTRSTEADSIVVGNPARLLRLRQRAN